MHDLALNLHLLFQESGLDSRRLGYHVWTGCCFKSRGSFPSERLVPSWTQSSMVRKVAEFPKPGAIFIVDTFERESSIVGKCEAG